MNPFKEEMQKLDEDVNLICEMLVGEKIEKDMNYAKELVIEAMYNNGGYNDDYHSKEFNPVYTFDLVVNTCLVDKSVVIGYKHSKKRRKKYLSVVAIAS